MRISHNRQPRSDSQLDQDTGSATTKAVAGSGGVVLLAALTFAQSANAMPNGIPSPSFGPPGGHGQSSGSGYREWGTHPPKLDLSQPVVGLRQKLVMKTVELSPDQAPDTPLGAKENAVSSDTITNTGSTALEVTVQYQTDKKQQVTSIKVPATQFHRRVGSTEWNVSDSARTFTFNKDVDSTGVTVGLGKHFMAPLAPHKSVTLDVMSTIVEAPTKIDYVPQPIPITPCATEYVGTGSQKANLSSTISGVNVPRHEFAADASDKASFHNTETYPAFFYVACVSPGPTAS